MGQAGMQHKASKQIVREQLEQKHGVIGHEGFAWDLAEGPGLLELRDERLDAGAAVVFEGHIRWIDERVVGEKDLLGPIQAVPERGLPTAGVLAGPACNDAHGKAGLGPRFAHEVDLGVLDSEAVMDDCLDILVDLLGADRGLLLLTESDGTTHVVNARGHRKSLSVPEREEVSKQDGYPRGPRLGQVHRLGAEAIAEPVVERDVTRDRGGARRAPRVGRA